MKKSSTYVPRFSSVLEVPAAPPQEARAHFLAKLAVETDPSDVHADLTKGIDRFVLVDARSEEDFRECHIPGAVNLPHRTIDDTTTADLTADTTIVVYCWSPACNAAAKAAVRLTGLGFRVKEMIGGIEYWRREGYAVEGENAAGAPLVK